MSSNSLFVAEEHEGDNIDNMEVEPSISTEDVDPITERIPVSLSKVPYPSRQMIHLLQFYGRPKSDSLIRPGVKTAVKKESGAIKVKVPIETGNYYDRSRVEKWGAKVVDQTLQGVLDMKTGAGTYAARLIMDGEKKKMVLIPIDSSAQLRPTFTHLDEDDSSRYPLERKTESSDAHKTTNVHVLQTAGKASNAISAEGQRNAALGESLKSVKIFEEEAWKDLLCKSGHQEDSLEIKSTIDRGGDNIKLKTDTKMADYLDTLINS